jgi:hypothetical protein
MVTALAGFLGGVGVPGHATAQELGIGVFRGSSSLETMPGGPGVEGWLAVHPIRALAPYFRVQASAAREWGRSSEVTATCALYWPEQLDCVQERAVRRNLGTSFEVAPVLVTPAVFGLRVGAGYGFARHSFEVSRRGESTGRVEEPLDATRGPTSTGSWFYLVEESEVPGSRARMNLTVRRFGIEYEGCVMDTWAHCGRVSFTRVQLGMAVRVR